MTTRDPRIDPQRGDVILVGGKLQLTVTLVERYVFYELRHPYGRGIYAIPLAYKVSRAEWRDRVARNAEVQYLAAGEKV